MRRFARVDLVASGWAGGGLAFRRIGRRNPAWTAGFRGPGSTLDRATRVGRARRLRMTRQGCPRRGDAPAVQPPAHPAAPTLLAREQKTSVNFKERGGVSTALRGPSTAS